MIGFCTFVKTWLIPTRFLLMAAVLTATCLSADSLWAQKINPEVARFVGEVIVGREYAAEHFVAMKWDANARLSVFGADEKQTRVIRNTVRKINEALRNTKMQIELLEPEDPEATLKVYFADLVDFPEIAERENISYVEGNLGFFFARWTGQYTIDNAVVMLAADHLEGEELNHIAMEEITQSLGLPGDSSRFENSLFYEDPQQRRYGSANNLSGLDARVLRFLYQKVKPGMHATELGILMAEHWGDAK
jgi:hypothetical protein